MKSLILAAGYATRLYPLTRNFPKPLLDVGGKTILDRLLTDLDRLDEVEEHIIVSNNTFFPYFMAWKNRVGYRKPIHIINDGAESNETRLGAVRDILLVVETLSVKDDLLVLAGDNVVDFSFEGFVRFARQKQTSCITCHHEPSVEALRKTGVLEMDGSNRVLMLHEKPANPPTNWAVPPFYLYHASDLTLIRKALTMGCGFDAPGNLAAWLAKERPVHAWEIPGKRYDIGDVQSYESVQKIFKT